MAKGSKWRTVMILAVLGVPALLIVHALFINKELQEMKRAYLRSRAAAIAGRLEVLPGDLSEETRFDELSAEEPALANVRIFEGQDSGPENASLAPIWAGRLLFRTAEVTEGGEKLFRAYVPFHSPGGLRIARIDLAATGADFLLTHVRRNLMVTIFVALLFWTLTLYALWASRRMAALEHRELELKHLAHMGTLSAVLAHEIRNPLGTIKGFVQLAAERADSKVAPFLGTVVAEALRLERLVNDLLAYGRPREPVMRMIRWQALAPELASAVPGVDARVRFTWSGGDWEFESDPELLKQVLLNLVRNAVEAVDGVENAEVRISAAMGRRGFTISIADNGPGIRAEMRSKVFEPFVTTKASGTGLGLSIARKVMEMLGGALALQENQPRGTVAEISFPPKAAHLRHEASWKPSS